MPNHPSWGDATRVPAPPRHESDGHAVAVAATSSRSAAAPSPFPPIADYGFLSNCHTGALVAPDGAVEVIEAHPAPVVFWATDLQGRFTFLAGRELEALGLGDADLSHVDVVAASRSSPGERHARSVRGQRRRQLLETQLSAQLEEVQISNRRPPGFW